MKLNDTKALSFVPFVVTVIRSIKQIAMYREGVSKGFRKPFL